METRNTVVFMGTSSTKFGYKAKSMSMELSKVASQI